jgi:maltose O-acetyltransferase
VSVKFFKTFRAKFAAMDKTEKQKMLAGELYLAADPVLVAERHRARRLTRLYNSTTEEETETRSQILLELFSAAGPTIEIEPPFYCDYGSNIYAGDGFYMNFGGVILDCNPVHIGEKVLCGPSVHIYTATHPTNPETRLSGLELAVPVRIGNNVWIGGGAIICPGVTIGDHTTIAAGSVVVKDIPARVVAGGNPCRVIRQLE